MENIFTELDFEVETDEGLVMMNPQFKNMKFMSIEPKCSTLEYAIKIFPALPDLISHWENIADINNVGSQLNGFIESIEILINKDAVADGLGLDFYDEKSAFRPTCNYIGVHKMGGLFGYTASKMLIILLPSEVEENIQPMLAGTPELISVMTKDKKDLYMTVRIPFKNNNGEDLAWSFCTQNLIHSNALTSKEKITYQIAAEDEGISLGSGVFLPVMIVCGDKVACGGYFFLGCDIDALIHNEHPCFEYNPFGVWGCEELERCKILYNSKELSQPWNFALSPTQDGTLLMNFFVNSSGWMNYCHKMGVPIKSR